MAITVVGSINLDIVARTDEYPKFGETLFGKTINFFSGGKGANQATACSKLGKEVYMIGCVGNDTFGDQLIEQLKENKVNTTYIKRSNTLATGTAIITIDKTAENTMLVLKGANDDLSPQFVNNAINNINDSNYLVVQMEVPEESVIQAMKTGREKGMTVILDPAPAEGITVRALKYADIIVPNRQETKFLTGIEVTDESSALEAAKYFEGMGVSTSIIKMADKGSLVYQNGHYELIESIKVEAIDTVGAGDSFAGALANALSDGKNIFDAARFATIVGALKVTKLGAQKGIPTLEEVKKFSEKRKLTQYLPVN
jgi:ribokinase